MDYFKKLGDLVTDLWAVRNCVEEMFPQIAMQALTQLPPDKCTSISEIANWAFTTKVLPAQTDLQANFGQPPITLYNGRDFRIEVLFWVEGVPGIHHHSFSGAFHVLHGASLHSLWSIGDPTSLGARLQVGRIAIQDCEILLKGQSREIQAGPRFIHSTFHLQRPSASVVIRTIHESKSSPQFSYLPPSIAYDPFGDIPIIKRRAQILKMLLKSNQETEFWSVATRALDTSDTYAVFQYLYTTYEALAEPSKRERLFSLAARQNLTLVNAFRPSVLYTERKNRIINVRRKTTDPEIQFFLALVLNVPNKAMALKLVRQHTGSHQPWAKMTEWIRQLSNQGLLGIRMDDAWLEYIETVLSHDDTKVDTDHLRQKSKMDDRDFAALKQRTKESWFLGPLFDEA